VGSETGTFVNVVSRKSVWAKIWEITKFFSRFFLEEKNGYIVNIQMFILKSLKSVFFLHTLIVPHNFESILYLNEQSLIFS
jgi:hypothetical protein